MNREVIFGIIMITVVLAAAYASQQLFPAQNLNNISLFKKDVGYSGEDSIKAKAEGWINGLYSGISGEVEKRGEIAEEEIAKQKKEVSENIANETKKVIAEKILQILNVNPESLVSADFCQNK